MGYYLANSLIKCLTSVNVSTTELEIGKYQQMTDRLDANARKKQQRNNRLAANCGTKHRRGDATIRLLLYTPPYYLRNMNLRNETLGRAIS